MPSLTPHHSLRPGGTAQDRAESRHTGPVSAEDESSERIGSRLRELRRARNLTLRQLAESASVSASLISQVETGRVEPSITSLRRIATGLGVPITEFFSDGDAAEPPRDAPLAGQVVRRDRRKRLQLPQSQMLLELLTPNLRWDIEFVLIRLEPGHPPHEPMSHPGQECCLLVEGVMHVTVGDEIHRLEAGDSIAFDSGIPHFIENRGTETVVQVSAITPPAF